MNWNVPVLDTPDRKRFLEATQGLNFPVKLTGLISSWKALKTWSMDHLCQVAGDCLVRACENDKMGTWYENVDGRDGSRWQNMRLCEFVQFLAGENASRYYAGQISIQDLPPLVADAKETPLLELIENPADVMIRFWLGRNNATQMHYDLFHTFTVELLGNKKITLFMPKELSTFYPMDDRKLRTTSRIRNPFLVDRTQFPDFSQNEPFIISLEPGEVLFIPIFWWHFAKGGDSVNLNLSYHFMETSLEVLLSPYLHHYLRGLVGTD